MRQTVTIALICNYGFWKELRPVTPFLTPYLVSPYKNFTDVQLYSQVYPFSTYSYLIILIPVFILTDLLRNKPVLICESLAYIGTWVLLIWGTSIFSMQAMQMFYGIATATEVAYYSYIYAIVDEKHFKLATSLVRGSVLFGRCFAYGLGQLLVSTEVADYMLLNYISLACLVLTFSISLTLPCPPKPLYIQHSQASSEQVPVLAGEGKRRMENTDSVPFYFKDLSKKFVRCYKQGFIVKWSLWWAFGTCGFFQVGNYIQNLWETMQHADDSNVYNGITEAINTLLGAIVAMGLQLLHINWKNCGELVLGLIALIDAGKTETFSSLNNLQCAALSFPGLLIILSQTSSLLLAYILYVIFCVLYQLLITIATYNVARHLESASHGFVFGCNTFVALFLQTCLTFAVADEHGFNVGIRPQFLIYGAYHGVISIVFLVMGTVTINHVGLSNCWSSLCKENGHEMCSKVQDQTEDGSTGAAELYTTRI